MKPSGSWTQCSKPHLPQCKPHPRIFRSFLKVTWRAMINSFVECLWIWVCLMISHHRNDVMHFLKGHRRNNAWSFLVNHIKWFIIRDVIKLGNIVKVASSMVLHNKVTIFSFVLYQYIGTVVWDYEILTLFILFSIH